MNIIDVHARQILDSRGNPTIEAEITLDSGATGSASVPSGASRGKHEAHELRDGVKETYGGSSVKKAISHIQNEIQKLLKGMPADDQFAIDNRMIEADGSPDKSHFGANAILSVSLACAKAAANERHVALFRHLNDIAGNPHMSLPMPMINIVNGGKHALSGADFQEAMVIPYSANDFAEAVHMGSNMFHALRTHLENQQLPTQVGDEGGFAIGVSYNEEVLQLLEIAATNAGYKLGTDVVFALDVAASELYANGKYILSNEHTQIDGSELIRHYDRMARRYPLASIEDGLAQDDWLGWERLTHKLGMLQLVGDDLLTTNPKRLKKAIDSHACNAILIKPNQIGTLTETVQVIKQAQAADFGVIVSHRSGETEDTFIAHLAVGTGACQIKTGSVARGERTAKYNEILRIAEQAPELDLAKPLRGVMD